VPYNMIGSNMVYNIIHQRNLILRTEGLSIFEYKVSSSLSGMTVKKSGIRKKAGCNIICLRRNNETTYDITELTILNSDDVICMIGTTDQEHIFFNVFNKKKQN